MSGSIFERIGLFGVGVCEALLLASLVIATGNAAAQNATNRANVRPPTGVTNTGAGCTAAGGVFDSGTGTCTATDDDPIFRINLSKTAGSATGPAADGSYSVGYTVAVANATAAAGSYGPITDTPSFPANLQVISASWTCSGGCTGGSATGAGPYQLAAAGTAIAANATHTYSLTVKFQYTDSTPALACSGNTPGRGLYNKADLPAGAESDTSDNAACAPPPSPPAASLELTKTAGAVVDTDTPANGAGDVGDTITYTFAVKNTGNVALTNVNVTDPLLPSLTCTAVATLAPGASQTLSCSAGNVYVLTQTDVDNGKVDNTATGRGTTPSGGTVTDDDSKTVTITAAPSLELTKTAGAVVDADTPANGAGDVGDTITYSFAVKNTGNVALTNVNVTDPLLPSLACTAIATLAPGASQTLTCSAGNVYVLTQTDVDNGKVENTATGKGTTPSGGTVSDDDSKTVAITAAPSLELTKTAGAIVDTDTPANGAGDVGDTITYTFAVKNTGNVALTNVNVTDPLLPSLACTAIATLAPGASQILVCTAGNVYVLTQTDVDNGKVDNTATGKGTTPSGGTVSDDDSKTVAITAAPSLELTKTAGAIVDTDTPANGAGDVGDTITYTFAVKNTGNVALTNVNVTDPLLPSLACTAITTLAPGASQTLSCTAGNVYVLTQTDVDNGKVDNTATGKGTSPSGTPVTDDDSKTVTIAAAPSLELAKTAGAIVDTDTPANGAGDVGDTITYTFAVKNSGNVALTNVNVTDPLLPSLACTAIATLAPGASQTLTCSAGNVYTLTQTDVDAGKIDNTATGKGTTPSGTPVTDDDSKTVTITAAPSLEMTKTAGSIVDTDTPTNGAGDIGDTITYSFAVKNTGNVALTNVNVTDPLLPSLACTAIATLAPGASQTLVCTAGNVYVLTQTDVDAGKVDNTATGKGTTPSGTPVTDDDSKTVTIAAAPSLELTKTAGSIVDTDTPANGAGDVGDTITYSFAVKNTGNVALTNVNVTDPLLPSLTCTAITTLAPGASQTLICTAGNVYTLTQADVDAGKVDNTATGRGTTPSGTPVTDDDSKTVTITADPSLELTKIAGAIVDTDTPANGAGDVGDTITYTFAVKNIGNVALTNVNVTDPLLPSLACTAIATLAPGASQTLTCSAGNVYTLTQADVDSGKVDNTATGRGTTPSGTPVTDDDSKTVTITAVPSLELTKTAGAIVDTDTPANGAGDIGDTITYTFAVKNTGNVALTNVNVTDPLLPSLACTEIATLAPGASQTLTCTAGNVYTLTQADVDAGKVDNTATGKGATPSGTPVSDDDSKTVTITSAPSLELTKTAGTIVDTDTPANGAGDVGDTITYSFAVKNTGNVALTNVNVTDPLLPSLACTAIATLAPGASQTLTCSAGNVYTLTQADVDNGKVDNTATGKGTTPSGTPVTDDDSKTVTITAAPSLELTKTAGAIVDTDTPANGAGDVGDTISYSFAVKNTGNVALTNVNVTDPLLPSLTCAAVATLAPGATQTLTCSAGNVYALTQTDVDAGKVDNTATGKGTTPSGGTVSDDDSKTVTITAAPSLELTKTAGAIVDTDTPANGAGDVGDTITYTFAVKNTGNVALTNVNVTDPLLPSLACTAITTLAPGASQTLVCSAGNVYTLTQTDVDAGKVDNTATGKGTTPGGTPVTDDDSKTVTIAAAPSLELTKTAGAIVDTDTPANGAGDVGDTITYTFAVKNTGNVALTNVNVTDPLLPSLACTPVATLAPGASQTLSCTAGNVYTLTQADVNNGKVDNTATGKGTTPSGTPVTDDDSKTVTISAAPNLALKKERTGLADTDNSGGLSLGDTLTYTVTATNTGNTTLTNVVVRDDKIAPATTTCASLAPGGTCVLTGAYVVVQTDVDAGKVLNNALVTDPTVCPTGSTDPKCKTSHEDPITAAPSLELTKTAGAIVDTDTPANGVGDVGDTITYSFAIKNAGNVALTNVNVTDPLLPSLACTAVATLAPGATQTLTCTAGNVYTLTQADVDSGKVDNTATGKGTTPSGTPVTDDDSKTVTIAAAPSLELTKTAGSIVDTDTPANGAGDVGDTITYSFAVKNTGNVALTNVNVTDPLLPSLACTAVATLAPGATQTLVCSAGNVYTLTQADVDAGKVDNTATGKGTTPSGTPVTDDDSKTVAIAAAPSLELTKTAGAIVDTDTPANGAGDAGDTITYSFAVKNTGNVALTNVNVTDPLLPSLACTAITTLAPGASQTLTCTAGNVYTLTQADVNNGKVDNTATGKGTTPSGTPVSDDDSKTVTIAATPNLALKKERTGLTDTDNSGGLSLGDTLTYTVTATNTGNTTLTNVVVRDDKIAPATTTCASLAPGGTCVLTGTYVVVQADVDAGKVLNNALVTDPTVCPTGSTDPKCKTSHEEPITAVPSLELTKTAGAIVDTDTPSNGAGDIGDTITYSFAVKNTGNVALTNVNVTDPLLPSLACTAITTLAPGASQTLICSAGNVYVLTQADVDSGKVDNTATSKGTTPSGGTVSDDDSKTVTITSAPSLELTKTAGTIVDTDTPANGAGDVGDTITYSFAVKNTGNVALTNVNVTDPLLPSLTCTAVATLAPGANQTLTCSAGNVYTLTQTDVDAGKVDNTATGKGTTPSGTPVTDDDSKTVTIAAAPSLELTKTAGSIVDTDTPANGAGDVGYTITYTFAVKNTGNVALTNVNVTDPLLPSLACTAIATLAPGASQTLTCSAGNVYVLTQTDVDNGKVDNTATGKGTTPSGGTVSDDDSKTVTITAAPSLELTKTAGAIVDTDTPANGAGDVGDTITYTFAVKNTGNVALTNVNVTDPLLPSLACTAITTLAPGASQTLVCSAGNVYVLTQTDVDNGKVDNTATGKGTTPSGTPVTDDDSKTVMITSAPSLELTKTAGTIVDTDTPANGAGDVGDTITYTFAVKNTGNVALTNVNVTDPLLPSLACTAVATLAPGVSQALTCSAGNVYTLTQADVNNGKVDNTATGKGTTPSGTPVTDDDSKTVTIAATPNLALKKERTGLTDTDNSGGLSLGDTLTYTVTATNTGNTTLTNVVVRDDKIAPATTTCASLAPGGTCVLTGTYVVVQADVDAGKVLNNALVTDPTVCPTGSTDPKCKTSHEEPIARTADLTSVKSVTANADEDGSHGVTVGDTLTYSIIVTNIGTVPLTHVVVSDNKITPSTTTCATVAPSQNCVLTGTYKVALADANAGIVRNAATVTAETPPGVPSPCAAGATDPKCTPKHDEPVVQAPGLKSAKTMDRNADEDGDGRVSVGDTLTYSITATNTGNTTLIDVVVTDSKIAPNTIACASVAPGGTCVLTGTYKVVQADVDAAAVVNTATVTTTTANVCPAGSTDAACKPTVTVPIQARPAVDIRKVATLSVDNGTPGVGNVGDVVSYAVRITNTGNISLNEMATRDVLQNYAPTQLKCGAATLAPGAAVDCEVYTHTITRDEARAAGTLDNVVTVTAKYGSVGGGGQTTGTATATSTAIMRVEPDPSTDLVVSKEARPQRVKIGDLVRYTVTIKNVGDTDAIDAVLTDTPPAGFSLVDGSLQVADRDGQGRLIGTYPVGVDGIDVQAGQSATVVYLLRVGAAVRPGSHVNSAYAEDGGKRSNVATASVELASDPMLDDSLLIGTVFDDRDEDRWQDPASLTDLRVQGGFAPGAYIAHSTTVDRGDGAKPEPDASSPMLHGIDLGKLAGRQSDADPVAAHTVTISQLLREPSFTDDFALTNEQGVTVRMDAAGNTRVERSGDAAKGLTGADPKVERRVAKAEGGYRVDYIVSNRGVDERGVPGVRVASVEGLLVETDQFGRYHLEGVAGGPWERGRNFILKVDPATLPPGSKLTTDNPLVRRLTPGVPVRFDFGVKLPPGEIPGPKQDVEMRIGEVFFDAGSAEVKPAYLPAVETMAAKVREYGGGEVVITADGESQALAMDRALAVRKALESKLTPDLLKALQISVRTDARDPDTMVVGFAEWPKLGEVLFDTDRSTIKPQYLPLMAKIAAALDELRGYRVTIVGHTDKRASDAYNVALGMRRAQAVYEAILAHASPEVRKTLRVDTSNDPDAPAGEKEQSGATR
ncbi:DUF7507 domain-containing protein [Lysobacter enzymogenes]|uniref:DUF7507 domain-containing protein n=1 Tax=Lysobacter enzymogenes TaxID=69 RepID=UPI001A977DFB|nr:OmpA family protein [Lysobacter enzymogenes]QQP95460.1 DUF11 domain-containing protein [Lysobacter enzymogenes]